MSDRQHKPTPRRRRQIVVFGLFTTPLLFAAFFAIVQHQRYSRLNADVINAGGKLKLPPPIWKIYWNRWHGVGLDDGTSVELTGKSLPPHFLRDHDSLSHLDIDVMEIRHVTNDATEFAELVAAHPIQKFTGYQIQGADEIAAALQSRLQLSSIVIVESDLSDRGFESLPLEDVFEIDVSETEVTPTGLLQLRRCRELQILRVTGTQLDPEAVEVIGNLPHAVSLTVEDSRSTDVLRQFKESHVRRIWLSNPWLTTEEIDQLQRDLPEIEVSGN